MYLRLFEMIAYTCLIALLLFNNIIHFASQTIFCLSAHPYLPHSLSTALSLYLYLSLSTLAHLRSCCT